MNREFRLTPLGSGRGLSCDTRGAFIGTVALLKRSNSGEWEPRCCSELTESISAEFGLPIDISPKMAGLSAIARALNDGKTAQAQIAAVLLGIPDPPSLSEGAQSRNETIRFIRDLCWSGLIKAEWDPSAHPRWPAGAPESQGGQFAPKASGRVIPALENDECNRTVTARRKWMKAKGKDLPRDPKTGRFQDVAHIRARADRGSDEPDNIRPLPHDEHVREHSERGDFARWAHEAAVRRAQKAGTAPKTTPKGNSEAPAAEEVPTPEEQITPDEIPLEDLPIIPE